MAKLIERIREMETAAADEHRAATQLGFDWSRGYTLGKLVALSIIRGELDLEQARAARSRAEQAAEEAQEAVQTVAENGCADREPPF